MSFSLLIVRNPFKESPHYGKWLAVNECDNLGWWIPGGAVDAGETFAHAAQRECFEEAGMRVVLKGILKVDHSVKGMENCRMRVIYYAEPENVQEAHRFKTRADRESLEARWVTLKELDKLSHERPGLRGPELVEWGEYLEKGGAIYPMAMFGDEGRVPASEMSSSYKIRT